MNGEAAAFIARYLDLKPRSGRGQVPEPLANLLPDPFKSNEQGLRFTHWDLPTTSTGDLQWESDRLRVAMCECCETPDDAPRWAAARIRLIEHELLRREALDAADVAA